MKKYIIISAFCAFAALCSCTQQELEPAGRDSSGKTMTITFQGSLAPSTKVQYDDAKDGLHNLTWTEGDAIGIFTYDQYETMNDNIQATLDPTSAGSSEGVFLPVTIDVPGADGSEGQSITLQFPQTNNERFVVYYPYNDGMQLNVDDGSFHSTVPATQTQAVLGDRKILANGLATAVATVEQATNSASFALEHKLAYICLKAASTEFSGYQLHSVRLYDNAGAAALAGDFAINPITGALSVAEGKESSSVGVEVAAHDFTAAPDKSELYLTVLPGDYTSADMYVVVTFVNEKGESQTVPMKLDKKCNFPAGSLTTIDLGDIASSMNTCPWYETHEKRDLLGLWAYGPQNTYFAMRPATKGATTEVTISVKARGDFSKVKEPKYWSLLLPSELGDRGAASNARCFLSVDGTIAGGSNKGGSVGSLPTYPINADYTLTVYVLDQDSGKGRWGSVAIYDEGMNLIWSFMINGYKEDDPPQDVQYADFTMLDRFLGQGNGNKKALEAKDFDGGAPAYFQWGRKDPLTWSNSDGLANIMGYQTDPVEKITDAIAIPTTRIGAEYVWYSEPLRFDLWGGYTNNGTEWYDLDAVGSKTVFDPCPEGYRVPDSKVLKEVGDNTEIWEVAFSAVGLGSKNYAAWQITDPTSSEYYIKEDTPFLGKKTSTLAYKLADGSYDFWPFLGYLNNSGSKYAAGRSSNNTCVSMSTWGNAYQYKRLTSTSKDRARGIVLEYTYWTKERTFNTRHDARMCYCYTIRCQKDDQGR